MCGAVASALAQKSYVYEAACWRHQPPKLVGWGTVVSPTLYAPLGYNLDR